MDVEQKSAPEARASFGLWIIALYFAPLFIFLYAILTGKGGTVPKTGEGIWSIETHANGARIVGSARKGDQLLLQAAGQTNFWECTFPQETIFDVRFVAARGGLRCNVTTAQRDVLLALTSCWPGESSRGSECHFQSDGVRQRKSSQEDELVEVGYWQWQSGTRAPFYAEFFPLRDGNRSTSSPFKPPAQ